MVLHRGIDGFFLQPGRVCQRCFPGDYGFRLRRDLKTGLRNAAGRPRGGAATRAVFQIEDHLAQSRSKGKAAATEGRSTADSGDLLGDMFFLIMGMGGIQIARVSAGERF